jgi:SAM-dependent methyltransferase
MLLGDVRQTIDIAHASLAPINDLDIKDQRTRNLHLESLGISKEEKEGVGRLALRNNGKIDPVVAYIIGATNGSMYKHLIGNLSSYPIPDLRLSDANGQSLIDLGCNWGRWCIAAARKGYSVVGIDPSLGAIMAAKRVNDSLGLSIKYLVADGRYLPFRAKSFQNVFSYSVLQHLSREDVGSVLSEASRVLTDAGICLIQMPTVLGLRCLYHQAKRLFREATDFEVRYWSIPALKRIFTKAIGRTEVSVDCYFGIGLQKSDYNLMPHKLRLVITGSEFLRRASRVAPFLKYAADSVYVKAVKP